jgi:hypothetical protein
VIKRTQKERDREANANSGRNLSKRTAGKDRFFENLLLLKSKSAKLMKVRQQPGACAQEIADQKDILRIFTNFYSIAQKSISRQQLPQILPSSN